MTSPALKHLLTNNVRRARKRVKDELSANFDVHIILLRDAYYYYYKIIIFLAVRALFFFI